jgi:hypothetical protein
MSKHDNIYNILGKLASLEPKPAAPENILKQLNESATAPANPLSLKDRLAQKLAETKAVDEELLMPQEKKFAALAEPKDKITYADKIAGAKKGDKKKDEGNEFSGELAKAKAQHKDSFSVDGKTYPVKEAEERTMSRAAKGYEKYGKEGMQALAKAGKEGKDLDKVRDKYNKYDDKEDTNEAYEPKNAFYKPGTTDKEKDASRDKSEKSMIATFKKSGEKAKPGSQIHALMKKHGEKVDEGEYQDGPNKSDVPAFQRKAKAAPGDQSWKTTTQDLDAEATKSPTSSAGLAKAKERLGMGQQVYDENNAHSSLPGTRKVSDKEHSEYDAAAHTVRKWMRKRGWDPKSEFKPAMKYIIDNLDSEHDDTLTDDVKMAACTCHKHHQGIVDEAFPTVADARARSEQEKGTGKFDKQQTSTGTRYTRKSDTFSDDDSESGEKSDAPKKKGRPAKNKGPERTTSKAWKHKGGRVTEAINLETYVEDTMAEIQAMFILEKDMGKHNNATTGFKALAKKAGGGEKGQRIAGAQFQKMKKAGQLEESVLTESTLQAIVRKFGKEVREFAEGGDIDNDLYEALYDYYFDDMPYGVKKGRDADPYEWIGDHFHEAIQNGDVEINETKVGHKDLDELAALAGIGGGHQIADEGNEFSGARAAAIRAGKDTFQVGGKVYNVSGAEDEMQESLCNMTAEGQMCPVHGLAECGGIGMMYEAKDEETADEDYDNDGKIESGKDEYLGSKIAAARKAGKLKEGETCPACDCDPCECDDEKEKVEECGMPGMMDGEPESGMSINSSVDTKSGRKTLTVTADGEAAEELAAMLKMAGLGRAEPEHHADIEVAEDYANEPDVKVAPTDAIMQQGNDLNKPKAQYKHNYKGADNPMAMKEDKLFKLLDAMKTK